MPIQYNSDKYAPGESAHRSGAFSDGIPFIEKAVVAHVAVFVVAASWAFGGNAGFVQLPLLLWGSLGVIFTIAAAQDGDVRRSGRRKWLHCLWPLLVLNIQAVLSALNPNYREMADGAAQVLVQGGDVRWLPSAARPWLAMRGIWMLDVIYITAFNLVFVITHRRALRFLLLVIGINALALSVFGTIQKFVGATGLFFGAVKSPNTAFFATFIYHNHWGPFILMSTAGWLGLAWHYARRSDHKYRDFFHSPAFLGLIAIVPLAASVALSTSRSCTILMTLLLMGAGAHWLAKTIKQRRAYNESNVVPLVIAGCAAAAALSAIAWLALPVISARYETTVRQINEAPRLSENARIVLYRDTWHMASERPLFGWGIGSYPTVFQNFNTQTSHQDKLPMFFADAHSDWLQALAELGWAGTLCIGALAITPLYLLRKIRKGSVLPAYLWCACGMILLYAWIEFPFGNFAVTLLWWVSFFTAVRYAKET